MDNEFRKENLSSGCIVQTRDGQKWIYFKKTRFYNSKKNVFINLSNGIWTGIEEYDDDLRSFNGSKQDILKICDMNYVGANIICHVINNTDKWTAEREVKGIDEEMLEQIGLLKMKR